ncbi:hypothetical protein CTI12_AA128020 [Artemisia annua]|uniref:Uncharacterized protein n=1 Tax=Artemisia annua TaxID=35608 RepID=A0A2U1PPH0_ARTAN|nr:hypothetical protein CTI12_AA128020 [Artemisia annua]
MATLIQENWAAMHEQDGLDEFESLEIDDTLLMSILDDPHVENECDDERLSNVIRSLEAEIKPIVIDDINDMSLELEWNTEWESSSHHFSTNQNYSKSQDVVEYNWMEMDDMYIQGHEDSMGGIIEFSDVKDYSSYISYGNNVEEHSYGALWQ